MKKTNKEVKKFIILIIIILLEGLFIYHIQSHNCRSGRTISRCQSAFDCEPCKMSEDGYYGEMKCHKYYDANGEIATEDFTCSC